MSDPPYDGTTVIDDTKVFLRRHEGPEPPAAARVRIVGVIPFLPSGEIVAVVVDRGIDLPSGHVESFDANPEAAVRREAREEAGLTLGPVALLAYLGMGDGDGSTEQHYVAVYTGTVVDMGEFRRTAESSERVVLTPDEFCRRYRQAEVPLFRILVAEARRKLEEM